MAKSNTDVAQCLESDVLTSRQLQAATGLSQPAVSRQIRLLGDRIVKLPNGKIPKYALTRNALGSGNKIPLFVVDAYGNNAIVADIRPLLTRGYFVQIRPGGSPCFWVLMAQACFMTYRIIWKTLDHKGLLVDK